MKSDRRAPRGRGLAVLVSGGALGLCLVTGFGIGRVLFPVAPLPFSAVADHAQIDPAGASRLQMTAAPTRGESLIAEWEQLRGQHENTTAAFPAIYTIVKDMKDAFRRRAFRAALIAEWAATDPQDAIAYFTSINSSNAGQVLREWIRLDPERAITQMLGGGDKGITMLFGALEVVARVAPTRLAEIGTRSTDINRNGSAESAFEIFARSDPEAARAAAESVTGPLGGTALAGVAKAWAESDSSSALEWVQAMPKGEARNAALRAVLAGWAKTDPLAALRRIDLVPPASRQDVNYGLDVGAEVLSQAARKDWDGTMRWLRENPAKLGQTSLQGLSAAVAQRLTANPIGTLQELQTAQLPNISNVLTNGLMSQGYAKCDEMWEWLDQQPADAFSKSVRGALLNVIAYKDPNAALARLEELADSPNNQGLLQQGARSLVDGRSEMNRIEDLLAKASPKIRSLLVEIGFTNALQGNGVSDPQKWLGRVDELPPERRADAAAGLAQSWAMSDPEGATRWALSLGDPTQRTQAIRSAVGAWTATDLREAAEWINSLKANADRDTAAVSLVGALGRTQPETAWTWALTIQAPEQRQQALQTAFAMLQRKDPALASQMVQGANLAPAEATALLQVPLQ